MSHTKEPWTFADVPGAGLEIYANVSAQNFVEYQTTGMGPTMIFGMPARAPTVLIAYERWVQFEPKGWSEMQAANAARIVACVNALAGIPDPSKSLGELREKIKALLARIDAANDLHAVFTIKDCDELKELTAALAALEGT